LVRKEATQPRNDEEGDLMKVLITGGAGYIGSTTASALEERGHTPIILDSLVNGRIEFTVGRAFYPGDVADTDLLARIVADHPDIAACIHCAALIVVPESVAQPYRYYRENVSKSLTLFHTLAGLGIDKVVFSSSASIYGNVPGFVADEDAPIAPQSPYARTKRLMETVLADLCEAEPLRGLALRYFNPIGADPAMRSGAYLPQPSHVLAKMMQAASGAAGCFSVTGTDWPTRDGSGLRDYIHVWDLAQAHVLAVEQFDSAMASNRFDAINLGTGDGVTVFELLSAFESVLGRKIPTQKLPPRPGDVAGACADVRRARERLGWQTHKTMAQAIADALKWDEVWKGRKIV
jgi:UDP-glucose 4-epimerase